MQFKNILFTLIIGLCAIQPISARAEKKISKEDVAKKVGKILGYTAELIASGGSYIWLLAVNDDLKNYTNVDSDHLYPSIIEVKNEYMDKHFMTGTFNLALQTPFFVALVHALHGLGSELAPVGKAALIKIKALRK